MQLQSGEGTQINSIGNHLDNMPLTPLFLLMTEKKLSIATLEHYLVQKSMGY
ncbi:hypothetical protein [Aquibacillus halophilus]|uniref:hypothetical protein n=1 Tax=Aquibacillus halophilus TaxID=930132 RepID=UPI00196B1644|nr:hypothetical protein [Aquibacillus halophilus]